VVDDKQIKKCGDCAYFGTPKCAYYDDFRKGLVKPEDKGCDDFFSKPKKEKVKYVVKPTVLTDEFLAEQIWDRKGLPRYMVYYFNEDRFKEVDSMDLGEEDQKGRKVVYVPVDNEALRKGLVLVPTSVTEATFEGLFTEADEFMKTCYDPCSQEALAKLLVRVAIGSWWLDRFVADPAYDIAGAGKFAPIIPIRGPSQSGKNRFAFVLRLLSYRPYFEMSTYRVPSLYRPLDVWRGTLVLDEADFANTSERSELIHYLNCRATGTPVSRQDSKNPKITHTFYNFGLTILTQRKQFDDNATESRCLPFYSEKTEEKLPTVETDEMLKWGLELQNKLLYLRMKFFKKVVIDKTAWIEGLSDSRLIASLLPLIALAKYEPSVYHTIVQTGKQVERLKIEEKANSEDGVMVNLLWDKVREDLFEVWNNPIYFFLDSKKVFMEKHGEIEVERVVKKPLTTSVIAERLKWTARRVRKVVKGLNLCRRGIPDFVKVSGKAYRVIFFEPQKLEKRLREFVVDYKPGDMLEKLGVTEVTQVTDYIHGEEESERVETETSPCRESVTSETSVTEEPDFLWCKIDVAERCPKCGERPVEYKINDLKGRQILRRCPVCFQKMRQIFSQAVWKEVKGF